MSHLQPHQQAFIDASLGVGALKFGSFTLKSGRVSPYFFNAGLLSSGSLLSSLAAAYATLIAQSSYGDFDILFGPAYKGIPLAAATAVLLYKDHNIDVGFAYDRKEAKDHGEGGKMVGADVKGKKVLILDDVMTAGTACRSAIDLVKSAGGEVIGVVMCLDREEVGSNGQSTVKEVNELLGGTAKVQSIIKMSDLTHWLEEHGDPNDVQSMRAYWEKYGVKD